jgi:DNA-binding transcriptional regulator LsrR (DeoR family)
MAQALGMIFERDLKNGMHIGFGWGTTLRGVAEKIYFNRKHRVKIVPMVGGLGSTDEKIHANSIVTLISEKSGGEGFILNCPAIVKNKKTRDAFMTENTVRDVLALADKVSIAVVSLGYIGSDITIRKMNLISDAELDYLKGLDIIGDINANFINESGNAIKNKFQDKIITVDIQNLQRIKNVVGVAFGEKKVPILKAALRNRIIDTLITDSESAIEVMAGE